MIIRCPGCGKRISNRHKICPQCRCDLVGSGEGLSVDEARIRRHRQTRYRLEMHSYAAILVTVIGVAWVYFSSDGFDRAPGFWPTSCLVAGALWYLSVRVYSIFIKLRG